jgi:anti-sigma B factor antagonist
MRLEIREQPVGDVTVLYLKGRLVFDDGDSILRDHVESLVGRGRIKLVLNMSEVTHIDSAGLGTLAAKYVTTHRAGGDIRLCYLTPRAHHVMSITNLLKVFRTYESEEDAIGSFTDLPAAGSA